MSVARLVAGAGMVGLVSVAWLLSGGFRDAGIRTTCGSLAHAATGRHDPTVVVALPAARAIDVDVRSHREGSLRSTSGRLDRVRANIGSAGAECSARSGSYHFEITGSADAVALELTGVGPARLILEHDGHVLRSDFVDVSAEESLEISL